MRVLVTGAAGQLARSLAERAKNHPEHQVMTLGRPQFDLRDGAAVKAALQRLRPEVVVNAAAYTAVDKAESEAAEAFAINRDGAAAVAAAAAGIGARLLQISTDYVYAGDKTTPYREGDSIGPLGVYGESKLSGEQAVQAVHGEAVILRTSWVYSPFGQNFVKTMLRLAGDRPVLRVVDDQVGNPTSALALADAIYQMIPNLSGRPGVYHAAGSGHVSWCGLARPVFALSGRQGGPAAEVVAIATADYPTPARRPQNSRLDTSKLQQAFGVALPPWQESLVEVVERLLAGQGALGP
jgi:dTDP-4-dehydrorhamnose reductase